MTNIHRPAALDRESRGLSIVTIGYTMFTFAVFLVTASLLLAVMRQGDATNPSMFQIGQTGGDARLADFGDLLIVGMNAATNFFK